MIYGIGTDLVDVNRMHEKLEKLGDRFAQKILSATEYEEFKLSKKPGHFLAKRFAAKEALLKALGSGLREGLSLHNIEIVHDELGKPSFHCLKGVEMQLHTLNITQIHLSITDEQNYALAFVILER